MLFVSFLTLSCNGLFFYPDRHDYFQFNQENAKETFTFPSRDGTKLSAWRFKAMGPKKGTVIHFHGNAQNMSSHFLFVHWLTEFGWDVFVFDYRGYGKSEGEAEREGLVNDGTAAIEFVAKHPDMNQGKLVVVGQSLGGAVAIASMAETTVKIDGLILDSTFISYQGVAKEVLAQHWLTWPFQWMACILISDKLSPKAYAKQIDIPVIVMHGDQDASVPISQGYELYDSIGSQHKSFLLIKDGKHTDGFDRTDLGIKDKVVRFLDSL